jgi:hypothetical protein
MTVDPAEGDRIATEELNGNIMPRRGDRLTVLGGDGQPLSS